MTNDLLTLAALKATIEMAEMAAQNAYDVHSTLGFANMPSAETAWEFVIHVYEGDDREWPAALPRRVTTVFIDLYDRFLLAMFATAKLQAKCEHRTLVRSEKGNQARYAYCPDCGRRFGDLTEFLGS